MSITKLKIPCEKINSSCLTTMRNGHSGVADLVASAKLGRAASVIIKISLLLLPI